MTETAQKQPDEIFLRPAQLVERYGNSVDVRTLANWRHNGTGPEFTKIGGKVLYRLSAVLKWEELRTVQNTSQYRKG